MKSKMEVKGEIKVAGVYQMATRAGKVLYVGSSIEIGNALTRHNYNLKRGKYADTNKRVLQEAYDRDDLIFEVIHKSAFNNEVRNMNIDQKENLQLALGVLEEFYINLNKETICNQQKTVHMRSSNKDKYSTIKRSKANLGSKNPNVKYSEKILAEILWMKLYGYKPRKIAEFYKDIPQNYISCIGITKWIFLEPSRPDFIEEII
mgnify:CR=1 FL=1